MEELPCATPSGRCMLFLAYGLNASKGDTEELVCHLLQVARRRARRAVLRIPGFRDIPPRASGAAQAPRRHGNADLVVVPGVSISPRTGRRPGRPAAWQAWCVGAAMPRRCRIMWWSACSGMSTRWAASPRRRRITSGATDAYNVGCGDHEASAGNDGVGVDGAADEMGA